MKILEASAGLLTNFEVLDFLRNKGDSPLGDENVSEETSGHTEAGEDNQYEMIKRSLTPSEMKVYDYLVNTAARDQTRECVSEFLHRCKKYDFAQADMLPIINIRPSQPSAPVELYSMIESFDKRYESKTDEIIQMIDEVLPPRPISKSDEEELVPVETLTQNEGKTITEPQQDVPCPEA